MCCMSIKLLVIALCRWCDSLFMLADMMAIHYFFVCPTKERGHLIIIISHKYNNGVLSTLNRIVVGAIASQNAHFHRLWLLLLVQRTS